jgi:hypothetical protein
MRRLVPALALLILAAFSVPPGHADPEKKDDPEKGTLDTFEEEATDEEPAKAKKENDDPADDSDEDSLFLTLIQVPFYLALAGGTQSWERVLPPTTPDGFTPPLRSRGESLIPFLRVDLAYQDVTSDVQATDARVEGGFGPFGIQVRYTHYTEESPDDVLDFTQIHGLYRMSVSRYVEIDLGFGAGLLSGDGENSGFSFALPLTIQPTSWLGLGFRPSWTTIGGNSIGDYDLRIEPGLPFVTAIGGYRWVTTEGATLEGPFLGGSFHF